MLKQIILVLSLLIGFEANAKVSEKHYYAGMFIGKGMIAGLRSNYNHYYGNNYDCLDENMLTPVDITGVKIGVEQVLSEDIETKDQSRLGFQYSETKYTVFKYPQFPIRVSTSLVTISRYRAVDDIYVRSGLGLSMDESRAIMPTVMFETGYKNEDGIDFNAGIKVTASVFQGAKTIVTDLTLGVNYAV